MKNDSDKTIVVKGLGKAYPSHDTPRARLTTLLGRGLHANRTWALTGVDFTLLRGQSLGIVGDNGAGKSTLLKLVAGTLRPTIGNVQVFGRLTAILELGAGFHPEFTGRENIYFSGSLIGISELEMRSLETDIIEFAELQDAIDRPVKTYSSGMVVRLAFSLVTALRPDVLIIDEALAVGDQHFQKKCVERIEDYRRGGCTILFCSHSLYHVRKLCDQCLWLDKGQVRGLGATEIVLSNYEAHVRAMDDDQLLLSNKHGIHGSNGTPRKASNHVGIISVNAHEMDDTTVPPALVSADLTITVTARAPHGEKPHIAVMLERADGVCVTAVGTHADHTNPVQQADGTWQSTLTFTEFSLYSGEYIISAYLFDSLGIMVYEEWRDCARFSYTFKTLEIGMVRLPHSWT